MKQVKKKTSVSLIALTVLVLLFFALPAFAQFTQPSFEQPTTISLEPRHPRPGQQVTIVAQNFFTDIVVADISWFVNGELVRRGIGENRFRLEAPPLGDTSVVSVRIITQQGDVFDESISITPAEVDIVWEAQAYTPPLYKGKVLFPPGGSGRAIAFPRMTDSRGALIDPRTLIYTWKQDGSVVSTASGFGKQSLVFDGSLFARPVTLSVEVETPDKTRSAQGRVSIPVTQPRLLVYENSPLRGVVFERALTSAFTLTDEELVLEAYPFHVSGDTRTNSALEYSWRVDRQDIFPEEPSRLVLGRQNTGGQARVSLRLQHLQRVLQGGNTAFSLNF